MTLLDDLKSLDVSPIVNARASIMVSVQAPGLQAIVEKGAGQTALGDLGTILRTVQTSLKEPAALIQPLIGATTDLSHQFQLDRFPVTPYLEGVREGATLLSSLLGGVGADPASWVKLLNLPDIMSSVKGSVAGFSQIALDDLGRFRSLVQTVDRGVPTNPEALAELAIQILLPFPQASLFQIRTGLTQILDGAIAIQLPTTRTLGLVTALDNIATVAVTGDLSALQRALVELNQVKANTITVIQSDLTATLGKVNQLRLEELLSPMSTAIATLRTGESGMIEYFNDWRTQIALMRSYLENLDPSQIHELVPRLNELLQSIEAAIQTNVVSGIDERVDELKEWVRSLLRHLQLRSLRAELHQVFQSIVQAIWDADLGRYARTVHEQLDQIRESIQVPDLGASIREELQGVGDAINQALDTVTAALQTIRDTVETLAGQAEGILKQAAAVLTDFRKIIDEVVAAIEQLGIEQVTQQVIDAVRELRQKGEELLSKAPLPEPLRPLVEQLIDQLQKIDLEAEIGQPVREKVAQIQLPPEIKDRLTNILATVNETLQNLIPDELITAIEAEINHVLDVIHTFNPDTLSNHVTGFINEAVDHVTKLDPTPLLEEVRKPFQAVLNLVDTIHPRSLLSPVLQAYDGLLGELTFPEPQAAAQQTVELINTQGEALGRTIAEPMRQVAGQDSATITEPGTIADVPPQLGEIRPGDIIRMFAYLPNKLREALSKLDASRAGATLQLIHSFCGGLAEDLRRLEGVLWEMESRLDTGLEAMLSPLAAAELNARFAIATHFTVGTLEVDAALTTVGNTSPDTLRLELLNTVTPIREQFHTAAQIPRMLLGSALEAAATTLEQSPLAQVGTDLSALLSVLDPEPIAAELDALVQAAIPKVSGLLSEFDSVLRSTLEKLMQLVRNYNPITQAQKFLSVIEVMREELDVLNPHRLVDELADVHAAIRESITAYDPAEFIPDLSAVLNQIATQLKALNPVTLLGDLSFLKTAVQRVESVVPRQALAGIGDSLKEVGEELAKINPAELLAAIDRIAPRIIEEFNQAIAAIRQEILALLKSLKYVSGSVSVQAQAEVG